MSTFIKFRDGTTVHILDIYVEGETMHKFVENENNIYERERTAIKRAIRLNRKKLHNSTRVRRRRRKIKHHRRYTMDFTMNKPTIVTYYEDGKRRHLVVETGKIFKRLPNAVKNVIRYVTEHSKQSNPKGE